MSNQNRVECKCRQLSGPRDEKLKKKLSVRISRINGQLGGVSKMIEEDRCCTEILTQITAIESALSEVGRLLLDDHINTCVASEVAQGNTEAVDKTILLMKKLGQ